MEGDSDKGIVCVTGGTGYLASWLILRLLQHGYTVRTTVRSDPHSKKDFSYLTNLPGASERLKIFNADLSQPDSFDAAIEGCIGVFHVAHPIDLEGREPQETLTRRAINGTLGILQACVNSKTVKRVVYTSSAATVLIHNKNSDVDESSWSDIDLLRKLNTHGASYAISKTLTERAALDFAEKHGLDLVSVIPSYIHGPFVTPSCPGSVRTSMALIFGHKERYKFLITAPNLVHVDDVAGAQIFLFEYPNAKGRYICSAIEITIDKLSEFLLARYPEYQIPNPKSLKEIEGIKYSSLSSKKLLNTGFKYRYALEEMFDEAIQCCKEKGFL